MTKNYDDLVANYKSLSDEDKKELLLHYNHDEKISLGKIAKMAGTYTQFMIREFNRLKLTCLTKSEIMKTNFERGGFHPTKGRERTDAEKKSIGQSISRVREEHPEKWDNMNAAVAEYWAGKTQEERSAIGSHAANHVRDAAVNGSRLEHFLREKLYEAGYVSVQHKTGVLIREGLEFDLYIPELSLVIEVDGPTHFKPIFGDKELSNAARRDLAKTALAIDSGFKMLRVKQKKNYSLTYFNHLAKMTIELVDRIKNKTETGLDFSVE